MNRKEFCDALRGVTAPKSVIMGGPGTHGAEGATRRCVL